VNRRLARDPPDRSFRRLAKPRRKGRIPELDAEVPRHAADSIKMLLKHQREALALEEAFLSSIERAQGAAMAGSRDWEKRHVLTAARFAERLAAMLAEERVLRRRVRRAMETSGIQLSIAVDRAREIKAAVATGGLPSSFRASLEQLGAGRDILDDFHRGLLDTPPAHLTGRLPAIFTETSFIHALQRGAEAYARLASRAKRAPLAFVYPSPVRR
jgi:hypothetical protein